MEHFWLIIFLSMVVGSIFLGVVVFFVVRRFVHYDVLKKHHDLAGFIIGTLGVLYSVFLGFTIVHAQDRYTQIISQVNREAYLCADLFRVAPMFGEKKAEIENAIRAYLQSVIVDEWKLMPKKEESPKTLKALENLWKPFYAYQPKTEENTVWFSRAIEILSDFQGARLARIYSTWYDLAPFSWVSLIVGAVVLMVLLFFFGTQNTKAHIVLNSFFIGYIALMLFTVYTLENPFDPPQGIKPKAYKVVYNYYLAGGAGSISPEREEAFPLH